MVGWELRCELVMYTELLMEVLGTLAETDTKANAFSLDELFYQGPQREFSDKHLKEIAFPLGGIGTGTISLCGNGALRDWEIFNRPNKGSVMPFAFFTLFTKVEGGASLTKVLRGRSLPPYTGEANGVFSTLGLSMARESGEGLPHMDSCRFRGTYPFADISYSDRNLPVIASLQAFNPFIPLNDVDSGIPIAIFLVKLANPGRKRVEVTLAANIFNAVGYPGKGRFYGAFLGKNINSIVDMGTVRGLLMTSEKYPVDSPQYGSLALATPWKEVTYQPSWLRSEWFDSLQDFWDEFSSTGSFRGRTYGPSDEGRSDVGSIGLIAALEPGEQVELPIYISWYFPNFEKYWLGISGDSSFEYADSGARWKNFYASQFGDAFDVARYVAENSERLYNETKLFHDMLFKSTLPPYVLDAVSSQASILRTATCLRLEDGTFYGFEGCKNEAGCCEGSCTHVWNYAHTHAFLFPELERSMRNADYRYNQFDDGKMCFRLQLPLGSPQRDYHAAADGQTGNIINIYRDWKISGDDQWLRSLWPSIRRAIEYIWLEWDKDKDGVMEGIQHNTYDIEFLGPNTMMGTMYLGALRAAEEMAIYLGEPGMARQYREVFESGSRWMGKHLFNGEFFVQEYDPEKAPKYQYGNGCLSDQLIGQWLSHVVSLGHLFDADHTKKTMESIFEYNWKTTFREHTNCQRIYAINDEKGLLLCTWPKGGRPAFPFVYSDEVWCGIEYQVASHLIYEGLVREGLCIVRGLRDRHNGANRNPWNEFECGSHYARSMASWSVLTALAGFSFDVPHGRLGFSPRIFKDDFRVFWSVGSGWGIYSQRLNGESINASLDVAYGKLELEELSLGNISKGHSVAVRLGERDINACLVQRPEGLTVQFDGRVRIGAGQHIEVSIE